MLRILGLIFIIVLSACAKAPTAEIPEATIPEAKLAELEPELIELRATIGQVANAEISFSNQGNAELDYNLSTDAKWLVLAKTSGTLAAATLEKIALTANCLEAQNLSTSLELKSNGGDKSISVTLECQAEPPLEASLIIDIKGLPETVEAKVSVTGINGFSKILSASETLTGLAGGKYSIQAEDVSLGTDVYSASVKPTTIDLANGFAPIIRVVYSLPSAQTGNLNLIIEGLPDDVAPELLLSKADFSQSLSQSQTLTNLAIGKYDLEVYPVLDTGASFLAEGQNLLSVTVEAGSTTELRIKYSCASVKVPDTALHVVLQEATEKTDYTCKDLEALGKLDLASKSIQSIKGLKYAKNLTELSLYKNPLTDISDLTKLTGLERLNLNLTNIQSLSPLSNLTALKELFLENTQVTTLSDLKRLKNLTTLLLSNTRVNDIADVSSLTALQILGLGETDIRSLAALAGLTKLEYLDLYKTQVSDLRPLASLSLLETLNLYETKVTELAGLENLGNLIDLDLGANNLSDIVVLKTLNKLEYLYLDENELTDIAVIGILPELKELYLNKNEISDIDALRTLAKLEALQLDNNLISNIEPLLNLSQLTFLNLDRNCLEPGDQPTRNYLETLQARALLTFAGNPKTACIVP